MLPDNYLECARQLFTTDSNRDLRDLAYIEVYFCTRILKHTNNLKWDQVSEVDRDIIIPKGFIEPTVIRHELSDPAIIALRQLFNRVCSISEKSDIDIPKNVFLYMQYGDKYYYTNSYYGGRKRFQGLTNSEHKEIIGRIFNHLHRQQQTARTEKIQNNPTALKLVKQIDKAKRRVSELESDLNYLIVNGSKRPKTKGDNSIDRNAYYSVALEEVDLSVKVYYALKRSGITSVGEVLDMLDRGADVFLAIRNMGEKSYSELIEKMTSKGYM